MRVQNDTSPTFSTKGKNEYRVDKTTKEKAPKAKKKIELV